MDRSDSWWIICSYISANLIICIGRICSPSNRKLQVVAFFGSLTNSLVKRLSKFLLHTIANNSYHQFPFEMKPQLSSRSETKVFIKKFLPESQLLMHAFYIAIVLYLFLTFVTRSDRWRPQSWNIQLGSQNVRLGKSSSAGSLAAVGLGNMMQNCILVNCLDVLDRIPHNTMTQKCVWSIDLSDTAF